MIKWDLSERTGRVKHVEAGMSRFNKFHPPFSTDMHNAEIWENISGKRPYQHVMDTFHM